MSEAKEFFQNISQRMNQAREHIPAVFEGFTGMFSKTMAAGTITVLEKELIALAIAVSAKCPPCIRMHVKKCFSAGATKQQILEAAGVAVMMGGGPAFMHIAEVMEAIEALEK